jgi:hypothetical protein
MQYFTQMKLHIKYGILVFQWYHTLCFSRCFLQLKSKFKLHEWNRQRCKFNGFSYNLLFPLLSRNITILANYEMCNFVSSMQGINYYCNCYVDCEYVNSVSDIRSSLKSTSISKSYFVTVTKVA